MRAKRYGVEQIVAKLREAEEQLEAIRERYGMQEDAPAAADDGPPEFREAMQRCHGAWDAVYTEEHWRTGKLGAVDDVAAARESLERLHAIAAGENARIIFGHDMGQWESLGMRDEPKLIAED